MIQRFPALLLVLAFLTVPVWAQQPADAPGSRIDEIRNQVARKQGELTPEMESALEQRIRWVNERIIESYLAQPAGFGLKFGGLVTGSGFALGPRYSRPDLASDRIRFDTSLVGSIRRYYEAEARLRFPRIFNRRVDAEIAASRADSPAMFYFGPGSGSERRDQTNYRREDNEFRTRVAWRPWPRYWRLGLEGAALLINTGPGRHGRFPSIEERFDAPAVPGLDRQSTYLRAGPFLAFDYRDLPGDPHRGGHYYAAYTRNWDQTWGAYSFSRFQIGGEQYIPFLNEKRVIALRVHTDLAYAYQGHSVPFYMQPTLGGPGNLRGFQRFRFQANNTAIANAEYRWEVAPSLDAAMFYDIGNVFDRPGLIGFRNLEQSGGLGLRVKTREAVVVRIDLGVSREGLRIWFVFNNIF